VLYLQVERHFTRSMKALGTALGKARVQCAGRSELAWERRKHFTGPSKSGAATVPVRNTGGLKGARARRRKINENTCESKPGREAYELPSKIRDRRIAGDPHGFPSAPYLDMSVSKPLYWRSGQKIIGRAPGIYGNTPAYTV